MSPAIQLESSVQQVIALRGAYMELWLGGGGRQQLPFPGKRLQGWAWRCRILLFHRSVGCPSCRGVALQHFIFSLHPSAVITSSVTTDRHARSQRARLFTTPGGERRLLKFYVFAFDCCGYSSDALNASHLANLRQGQGVTVWSTAGQTGRDIWGRGTLVPVRPHTAPMRDHRSELHGEQEFDWAQTKPWNRNPATPRYYYPSTAWTHREPQKRRAGKEQRKSHAQAH